MSHRGRKPADSLHSSIRILVLNLVRPEDPESYFFLVNDAIFFKKNGLLLNWKEFKRLEQIQQINTLAMILPFSDEEKQKLLEIVGLNEKIKIFSEIIEFYLHDKGYKNKITIQ